MAITKEKKQEVLNELVDKFSRSKTVVFADYRGLDVASVSDLRGQLREGGSECKVAKKTLMKLVAEQNKIDGLTDEMMQGPVAATFSYEDEMAGIKILFKFAKENENLKLLGGVIDGRVVGADEINALAKLPSKEELLAKMMGSMTAPVSGTVGVLSNLVSGLVRVLNAYKDTLPADGSAAPEVEAPAEEAKEEAAAPAAEEKAEGGDDSADVPAEASENTEEKTEETPADEAPAPEAEAANEDAETSEEEDDAEGEAKAA